MPRHAAWPLRADARPGNATRPGKALPRTPSNRTSHPRVPAIPLFRSRANGLTIAHNWSKVGITMTRSGCYFAGPTEHGQDPEYDQRLEGVAAMCNICVID